MTEPRTPTGWWIERQRLRLKRLLYEPVLSGRATKVLIVVFFLVIPLAICATITYAYGWRAALDLVFWVSAALMLGVGLRCLGEWISK